MRKLFIAALLAATAQTASAQDRIMLDVGYSPGGGFDTAARIAAEFLPAHLPGSPEIIVENKPGAGSLKLAKIMMADSVSDGSHLATVTPALALLPIFNPESNDFDPKKVRYIASMSNAATYCVASKASGIESLQQLLDSPDAKVGATGKSSTSYTLPSTLKNALGGKFQIILGFPGANDVLLAIERGEIDVRCGIRRGRIVQGDFLERFNVIAEMTPERRNEFEGQQIDWALDFAPDDATRDAMALNFSANTFQYPIIAGPNTTDEAVEMLRNAFRELAQDPAFISANEERELYLGVTIGDEIEAKIDRLLNSPEEVKARSRSYIE